MVIISWLVFTLELRECGEKVQKREKIAQFKSVIHNESEASSIFSGGLRHFTQLGVELCSAAKAPNLLIDYPIISHSLLRRVGH